MQDIPDLSFPLIALDFVFVELWFHLLRNILGDYNLIIRGWTGRSGWDLSGKAKTGIWEISRDFPGGQMGKEDFEEL